MRVRIVRGGGIVWVRGPVEERNVFVLVERLGSVALALQAREPWIWEAELARPGGRHLHFDRGAATTRGQGGGQLCFRGSKPFRQTAGWSGRECFRAPSRVRLRSHQAPRNGGVTFVTLL